MESKPKSSSLLVGVFSKIEESLSQVESTLYAQQEHLKSVESRVKSIEEKQGTDEDKDKAYQEHLQTLQNRVTELENTVKKAEACESDIDSSCWQWVLTAISHRGPVDTCANRTANYEATHTKH